MTRQAFLCRNERVSIKSFTPQNKNA